MTVTRSDILTQVAASTCNVGDIFYVDASGNLVKLDANTSTTTKMLTETGTGAAGQAPVWTTPSSFSGYSGYSGISGYSGWSGHYGNDGADGPEGASGWSGKSGFSGFSGPQGPAGGTGPTGASGISGWSGYSGATLGNNSYQVYALGVGTAAGTSGTVIATGDIVAYYSDRRLKTNIKTIPDALEKIEGISGVTYNANSTAQFLGYDPSINEVGIIAQDLQKVLPQAVKPAPINENYLTIQYEKVVPLLLNAIKELKARVEALEKKK